MVSIVQLSKYCTSRYYDNSVVVGARVCCRSFLLRKAVMFMSGQVLQYSTYLFMHSVIPASLAKNKKLAYSRCLLVLLLLINLLYLSDSSSCDEFIDFMILRFSRQFCVEHVFCPAHLHASIYFSKHCMLSTLSQFQCTVLYSMSTQKRCTIVGCPPPCTHTQV